MYLKSLELFGFKSFPDKTTLSFEGDSGYVGATIIVGPNGSGKSNISDAMRWVLGEVSSRQIRGAKMEDVIFGGTDDRGPMSFAEVSVTFDNSDRRMDFDWDEVTVTRRYYRKGESEYFINRKPVRLRDIHELFMNTGVGRDGYSIIGQGKIAEIISQKSDERRSIFEEAAGIARYRYKKEEAESKLASVDDNLTRLNDIMSELEGRVAPLERESERAKRYLELFEIKKRSDVALWLYDMEKLSSDLKEADAALTLAKTELELATDSLASLEEQNEKAFERSQESKFRFEKLRSEISANEKSAHELDSKIKLTENDITHRKAQIAERITSREKLTAKRDELEKSCTERETHLAELAERLAELDESLASLSEESDAVRTERAEASELSERQLKEIETAEARLVDLKLRLSVLDTNEKNDSDRFESLETEIAKYKESSSLLESRATKAERVIGEYKARADELKTKSDSFTSQIDAVRREKQELIDKANSLYLDYTAKKHRIDAIRRMEELFEGYSQSVRFVMSEYDAGRIEGTLPLSSPEESGRRIHGPISRLIDVSARYILAVETALGANIQNIVVDDESAAKAAMAHLKRKNAGRATFYPITSMKPRYSPIPEVECKKHTGYLGTADQVIKFDERYAGIIRNLLASTLIFDNIDNASAMAKATGYRTRIVTLDGQVINAGGSFTGGSAKRDSGMLTRKSETEKLKADVAELSRTLEDCKKEQSSCDSRIAKLEREQSGISSQVAMLGSLSGAENTQLEVIRSQLKSERDLLDSLGKDYEKLKLGFDERAEGIRKLGEESSECETKIAQLKKSRLEGGNKLGELDLRLDELEKKRGELNISRAETARDHENATRELFEARERLSESIAEVASNETSRESLELANSEAEKELESLRADFDELAAAKSELEKQSSALSAENVELEARLNQLRIKIREATSKKEMSLRAFTAAENRVNSLTSERDKRVAALWDDYELTFTTARECGYPAVTDENRAELQSSLADSKAKLKALGNVNLSAIDEYAEVKQRYDFMKAQLDDLAKSKENLLEIIFKLEVEMRETFTSAFAEIDRNFKIVFTELFGGGSCELSLTDPENVLESGIEIRVAPPGKIIKSLTLLSGGEQAFVAIALIFAILRVNPTPFCIFDEIEAALDESNVFRFADYLRRYSNRTQFIVITHRRGTMEIADRLYGVTMQERGISKVLTLDVAPSDAELSDKH